MKIRSPLSTLFISGVFIGALIALAGCTTLPETAAPEFDLPERFDLASPMPMTKIDKIWWRDFNSEQLNQLIEQAFASSQDLNIATERVLQAEYMLRSVGASRYPNLNLGAGSSAKHSFPNSGSSSTSKSSNLSINASYELDLWQRNAALIKGSQANLTATEFDLAAARLSLTASVAQTYFEVLTLKERLDLAEKNIAIAERLLEIVEIRQENGAATALDVSRQTTAVLSQKMSIIPLKNQFRQSEAALAVLVGVMPQGFNVNLQPLNQLTMVPVSAGLPSELLKRRPDIAISEQRLIGADANIHVAKTNLWPQISLTSSGGITSSGLFLASSPASSLALAVGLSQTLFDGGRKKSEILTAESKYRVLLQEHAKTILKALQEVEESLGNIQTYQDQERAQLLTLIEAKRSLELAELRYKEGADDLSNVLDSQRTLFQTQEQAVRLQQQRLSATVDLYKVMGGGWERQAEQSESE